MVSLVSPVLRLLRREERGAIGVLVAIMLGCGVLTGMGALVIDVGPAYQERADCRTALTPPRSAWPRPARSAAARRRSPQLYANANASRLTGGAAGVDMICGSGGLPGCPAPTGAKADCPAPPPGGTGYVQVYTSTLTAGGSTCSPRCSPARCWATPATGGARCWPAPRPSGARRPPRPLRRSPSRRASGTRRHSRGRPSAGPAVPAEPGPRACVRPGAHAEQHRANNNGCATEPGWLRRAR